MGETRLALSQVQDRIMALSGVHRTLYEADNLTKIDAADLIGQIAHQTSALAQKTKSKFDVEMDLNPVLIFPDQAVPLSMLVAEMLTNAIKYTGRGGEISIKPKRRK